MTTEKNAAQQYQLCLFELFIEGLSNEHPPLFQLLLAAEKAEAEDIYNDVFDAISKTGFHHPDFCQLVVHFPDAFNAKDYANYLNEFLNNELVPDVNQDLFSKALTLIWPMLNQDYLLKVLTSLTCSNEAIVCNATTLLINIYPLLSSINIVLALDYLIHGLEHELADSDGPLNENTILMNCLSDILHIAFPKCPHINTLISNYFGRFLVCNNQLQKLLYEKILIAAISTLKTSHVPFLFKEFEKAYQQRKYRSEQLIPLLKFIHALPLNNDEILQHAKYFFCLLQHNDFIVKQDALKILMKHFQRLSAICLTSELLNMIDSALILEEHFPEEFLRVEIELIVLERFSVSLAPFQKTVAICYLISILKETDERITVLYKIAATRMLQIVCLAFDNETIVNDQLMPLLNLLKVNYGSMPPAVSTGVLSLPALLKTQPPLSGPLLKVYRKHLTLFFTRFDALTDDRALNELHYDFELYYDSNSLKQVLTLFITSLKRKNTSLQEIHPWRMLLITKLISSKFDHYVIDNMFTLLITLHWFEHDRDKEEYALALLQFIKNCSRSFYRHAAIELLASVISLVKMPAALNFLQKTLLTADCFCIPEIPVALAACLKRLTADSLKTHLIQVLDNIAHQQTLTSEQKRTLCIGLLKGFPSLITIGIIKTYLEPNLTTHQQQYVKFIYELLNINKCITNSSTPGVEFFPSTTISNNTFTIQNASTTNPKESDVTTSHQMGNTRH